MLDLRRRAFITLIGGTAVAWPLAARAQQGERVRRIGVLHNFAADDPLVQARHGAFLQGLQQAGWTIGRNVQVETRWAGADADRIRTYAALIIARTGEGRTRAKARGVEFGRPAALTPHQRREAMQRLANGEAQADVARSFNVSQATISRLAAPSPFEASVVAA